MTGLGYALVCPLAYLLAGTTKFAINSVRAGAPAFSLIGLGGFPSTHTAIVSSAAWLIAINAGVETPAFAVAVAVVLVVVIDAMDLRRKLEHVNHVLKDKFRNSRDARSLRDRTGHTLIEIAGGLTVGALAASLISCL